MKHARTQNRVGSSSSRQLCKRPRLSRKAPNLFFLSLPLVACLLRFSLCSSLFLKKCTIFFCRFFQELFYLLLLLPLFILHTHQKSSQSGECYRYASNKELSLISIIWIGVYDTIQKNKMMLCGLLRWPFVHKLICRTKVSIFFYPKNQSTKEPSRSWIEFVNHVCLLVHHSFNLLYFYICFSFAYRCCRCHLNSFDISSYVVDVDT